MKILYLYVTARRNKERQWQEGAGPDTLLYGLTNLRKMGHTVDYFDDAFESTNVWRLIFWPVARIIYQLTGYGFKLDQAVTLLPKYSDYDVLVACGNSAGLPLGLLKLLRLINKPIVCLHMGGAEKVTSGLMNWLYRQLYQMIDKIIFFSDSERTFIRKEFGLEENRTVFCPLGIDTDFFKPVSKPGKYFLSVGRDRGRNFSKLLTSFSGGGFPLVLVSSARNLKGLAISENIKVFLDVSYLKLRELYIEAEAVLLPLVWTYRASGQLVLLESLAMNKPVLASECPGLLSGYDGLRKFVTITDNFAECRSKKYNKSKINAAELISKKYSSAELAKRLEEIYEEVKD